MPSYKAKLQELAFDAERVAAFLDTDAGASHNKAIVKALDNLENQLSDADEAFYEAEEAEIEDENSDNEDSLEETQDGE
jgi:DNA-directed RNA polymerase alpha subunit